MWHGIGGSELVTAPIEGVVVEQPCHEYWEWDEFSTNCELKVDGHTKHRWTYRDASVGVDVVIEWESYWDEQPETEWSCPDCGHMHKGKDENTANVRYYRNGACKGQIMRQTWAGDQMVQCYCSRRRPDKKEM